MAAGVCRAAAAASGGLQRPQRPQEATHHATPSRKDKPTAVVSQPERHYSLDNPFMCRIHTARAGSSAIPEDSKKATGGEDAHFVCSDGSAVGVADGVGGMWKYGVDPR